MKLPPFDLKFRPVGTGPDQLTVRETAWGYVVRSVRPGGGLAGPMRRLVTLAFWLAALGLWLAPAAWLPEPAFAARALGSVTLLAVIYAAFALIQRSQGYELQVDTRRRELRIGEVTPSGQAWIKASIRFDEVGDSVTRAADKARALRDLCLRVRDSGVLWPVAVGDEAAVFAVHTRLMADLRPLEERVSSYRLAAGQGAARRVFPPLVPQEIAA